MLQFKQIITVVRLVAVLLNPLKFTLATQQHNRNINIVTGLPSVSYTSTQAETKCRYGPAFLRNYSGNHILWTQDISDPHKICTEVSRHL